MTEKLNENASRIISKIISDENYPIKRSRGRPKGSKNKPKETKIIQNDGVVKKRGRPKGSKNKTTQPEETLPQVEVSSSFTAPVTTEGEHPLITAVKWIEKHMHISQMQYYKSRAVRNETSVHFAMAADILGFFNVQNADILKSIKKNNFVV